ncbi:ribonuclease P protein subunit p25-like protein [Athalia rosae]|uniref:ribonuclease P protein subunit p25-like protein n=1 Tax=Athalia rosae TaxID=37344 RepID=UPI0020344361|nr:ribonuclease P protein subunit p25-like protein [Athalia rosae]XP_048508564.1 ribonuclease P protein subunit p25-like protein [Athalia rosae]XP_048508565.1 ribonuclease P protein subunit p25-like protein [Athalia rosae]
MTKTSRNRRKQKIVKPKAADTNIPIPNLPEKFLWMHVNSGTKIRNVLNYALKEFSGYESVVWSGAGQGIGKVITCAELCKRKNPGLHQITRLRYVKSKKSEIGEDNREDLSVPEIHILLAKEPLDPNEPGYQSASDQRLFLSKLLDPSNADSENTSGNPTSKDHQQQQPSTSKLSNVATEEFAAMGLRTGQKKSRKRQKTAESSSDNKSNKKGKSD